VTRALGDEAQGTGLGADHVHAARRELLARGRLIPLGTRHHENRFTIQEMLDLERALISAAKALVARERTRADAPPPPENAVAALSSLNPEQRQAVERVIRGQGGLQVVCGMAGTGKSHTFGVARQFWEGTGLQALAACLSGKAASGLQESTGIEARTIHRLLAELADGDRFLDARTVVVVDEAAMVGTRHLFEIVRRCLAADAKLVLVGDAGQLQAIDPGGGFAALAAAHGAVHLTEIVRQRETWAREAVKDFAHGNTAAALAAFDSRGLVSVTPEADTAEARLLADWARDGLAELRGRIILAGTHEEVNRLNAMAQERCRDDGLLTAEGCRIGDDQVWAGDRILCLRNHLGLGVFNGDLGSVIAVQEGCLQVALDNGREVRVDPVAYPHLKLGYALTTHKAQGMTIEKAYVLTGRMQCRELTYVQASRARGITRFYVGGEDLGVVANRMQQARPKELATDVARTAGPVLAHELLP
jgi:ATP-dependent exoDNAse (exonuclease V) alpha subunit